MDHNSHFLPLCSLIFFMGKNHDGEHPSNKYYKPERRMCWHKKMIFIGNNKNWEITFQYHCFARFDNFWIGLKQK